MLLTGNLPVAIRLTAKLSPQTMRIHVVGCTKPPRLPTDVGCRISAEHQRRLGLLWEIDPFLSKWKQQEHHGCQFIGVGQKKTGAMVKPVERSQSQQQVASCRAISTSLGFADDAQTNGPREPCSMQHDMFGDLAAKADMCPSGPVSS